MPRKRTLHMQAAEVSPGGEDGYLLMAVLLFVAILTLSLAVAAPKVAQSIQRDREIEAIHRGEEYQRAIKLYYQKFNAYPTSIDQLVKSNDIRFLRRRYLDPFTGKDDWKLIHMGEAHVRPLGFFGQPLSMSGSSSIAGATPASSMASTGFGSSVLGSNAGTGSLFGTSQTSSFGATTDSQTTTGNAAGGTAGLYASDGNAATGSASTSGSTSSSGLTGLSNNSNGAASAMAFTGGSGGPVVGVTLPSDKKSLLNYRLQDTYNRWEFVYDPAVDQLQGTPNLLGGGASSIGSTSATSSSLSAFGSNGGLSSGFGSSSSSGLGSSAAGSVFSGGFGSAGASNSGSGSSTSSGSPTTSTGSVFAGGFGSPQ